MKRSRKRTFKVQMAILCAFWCTACDLENDTPDKETSTADAVSIDGPSGINGPDGTPCQWEEHVSADGQTSSRICVTADDPRAAKRGMNNGVGWLLTEELLERNPLSQSSDEMPANTRTHEELHQKGIPHSSEPNNEEHWHAAKDLLPSTDLESSSPLERSSGDHPRNCRWWKHSSLTSTTISQSCGSQKVFSGGCYISGTNPSTHLSRTQPYEGSSGYNQPDEGENLEDIASASGWVCQRYNPSGSYTGRIYVNALCCDHN